MEFSQRNRRRGSMVELMTPSNKEFVVSARKHIMVRSPRRGRSKSIAVIGA